MKRRRFLGAVGVVIVMPFIPGCSRSTSYRYRLNVIVDTPQGERTGSSVIALRFSDIPEWAPGDRAGGTSVQMRGEAAAVDLPDDHTLFALLRGENYVDGAARYAPAAIQYHVPEGTDVRDLEGVYDVPRHEYPMLVRFGDIDDPASVERVDPDNLAASFGPGVSLRAITVDITGDAVTEGIEERLVWLDAYMERGSLRPATADDPLEYRELGSVIATDFARR